MNQTKPKPAKSKLELREPAKPLADIPVKPLDPDHPAARIFNAAREDRPPYDQSSEPPPTGLDNQSSRDQPPDDQTRHDQSPQDQFSLLSALPNVGGHLEFPHQITDHLLRHLDTYEQAVYIQLYRLSWGHHKSRCIITNDRLGERANVGTSKVKMAIKSLVDKGVIKKLGSNHGKKILQGVEYEVSAPSWQAQRNQSRGNQSRNDQSPRAPNKEELLKETEKSFDASRCPDCSGTGYWYPEGTGKGVAKCRHVNLVPQS
jgi:hypothetical protein